MSASSERPSAGPTSALEQHAYRAGRLLGRIRALPAPPPWLALGILVVASWGIAAEAGRIAQHDGWLYFHGSAGSWYYTSAWALASGHLPVASVGYGYPLLIAPFALIAGRSVLDGMPWIIGFNQLVLAPIALVSVYGIVRMYAGRWYAYLTTLLWVLSPVLVIHYFLADYHTRYVDFTLPAEIGLTPLGEFPSMVALLVAVYFALRHVHTRAGIDAIAAGLAAGLAIAIKPANVLFLPAAAVALLVGRRPRGLGLFALALLPALVSLAIWRYRGLGHVLGFSTSLHWWHLHHNLDGLREYTWSQRMVYFAAVGGLIGLARRSWAAATLAGLWLASYLAFKGSSSILNMKAGSFFIHMIAVFPAFFLLAVSVPFLAPVYGGRRPPAPLGPTTSARLPKVTCAILGVILLAGLVAVTLLPKLSTSSAAEVPPTDRYVPLNGFALTGRPSGDAVTLRWARQQPNGTRASYAIFRAPAPNLIGSRVGSALAGTSFTDHPPAGNWTYRVAQSATAVGTPTSSDYVLVSRPVTVTVHAGPAGK